VLFGLLIEVFFVLFTLLDTELLLLVTLLLVFVLLVMLLERVDLEGVNILELDLVPVILLLLLSFLVLGEDTLFVERVLDVLLSLAIVREVLASELREFVLLVARVVLLLVARVEFCSAKRALRVLVISAFLRDTVLCTVRSLLFLGVCA
jgi:hypothetical protein